MTTPPGIKKVWRNIDWKSKEEKEAFYNQYFKNSDFAANEGKRRIDNFKNALLRFIEKDKIVEGKNTRSLKIADIINYLKKN